MSDRTMTKVHFTELREYSVDDIKRGERYLICHDSRNNPTHFTGGAFILADGITASFLQKGHPDAFHPEWLRFLMHSTDYWDKPVIREHFKDDAGIGTGRNPNVNFTLHVNDLLRKGIIVDTTPIKRDPHAPKNIFWDYS